MPRGMLPVVLLLVGACVPDQAVRHHTEDGFYLYKRGAYADARECFRSALALKPNDADLTYNLARCHAGLGQQKQAEELYKECVSRDPDHADARHAWLVLMLETGREAEGRRMVADWLQARPKSAGPYAADAWLRARDGDLDRARGRYQQALALNPADARALVGLGEIYEKLGRRGRALVLYERSLQAKPDQPELAKLVKRMRDKGVAQPKPD